MYMFTWAWLFLVCLCGAVLVHSQSWEEQSQVEDCIISNLGFKLNRKKYFWCIWFTARTVIKYFKMLCHSVWLSVGIWVWEFEEYLRSIWGYRSDHSESILPQVLDLFTFNDYFLVYYHSTIPLTHVLNTLFRQTVWIKY